MQRAQNIQDVLQRVIGRLGLSHRLRETDVVVRFADIVGDPIAQKARAVKVENGKLFVSVKSPTWRQELRYRKQEIISRLNEALGESVVRDIFFVN